MDSGTARASVRPLRGEEFDAWRERVIDTYGTDLARASGQAASVVTERARALLDGLLPDDAATAGHWLLVIVDEDGVDVGTLWIGPHGDRSDSAYVFDVWIDEAHRGRGLGRAAMTLAEQVVADAGFGELGLNVFGFNTPARALYDSLGYRVVGIHMTKRLGE